MSAEQRLARVVEPALVQERVVETEERVLPVEELRQKLQPQDAEDHRAYRRDGSRSHSRRRDRDAGLTGALGEL